MPAPLVPALASLLASYPLNRVEPSEALAMQDALRESLQEALIQHPAEVGQMGLHRRLTAIADDYLPDSSVNGDPAALIEHQMATFTEMVEALTQAQAQARTWESQEYAQARQAVLAQRPVGMGRTRRRS